MEGVLSPKPTSKKHDRTPPKADLPPVSTPETPIRGASVPEPSDQADKIERFAIPLDPSTGRIILENMRDASREKLIKAIRSTPQIDPAPPLSAQDAQAMNTIVANVLYDAISTAAIMAARSRGVSASSAALLRYSAEEKQSFVAPTIAVLEKYDLFRSQYREEFILLALVGTVTAAKIAAMQKAEASIVNVTSEAVS